MLAYQEKYVENTREIVMLSDFNVGSGQDFESWYSRQKQAEERMLMLKADNMEILNSCLFPALDQLHSADEASIRDLEEFAGKLMDWRTNLDCGIYLAIHDALLSYYRLRKDRNNIIKELYMAGMGMYYQRRDLEGVPGELRSELLFKNEMVFTEAASYLRYFAEIEDNEIRGYIIRSLHNISLCLKDVKRRIQISARALNVMQDEYYRQLAPDLPWDRFVRAAHQQMSINRGRLSESGITKEEIAMVLESCYEVFESEGANSGKNLRWIWPYYDMEHTCGYADLQTTVRRLEELIDSVPYDQYDESGSYANIQLVCNYARMMKNYPQLQTDEDCIRFLDKAYRKMQKTLLTYPAEKLDDYFLYNIDTAISNFYEMEGALSYRKLTGAIMRRYAGRQYIRACRTAGMMKAYCRSVFASDPGFFDDIPFIGEVQGKEAKLKAVLDFAEECGMYCDFGIIKMNMTKLLNTRELLEDEYRMYQLHTLSGYMDLEARPSTRALADCALGHSSFYSGQGGFPKQYVRTASPYRQMTDIAAIVTHILDLGTDIESAAEDILGKPSGRFSPTASAFLQSPELKAELSGILSGSDREYYRQVYDTLRAEGA